MSFTQHLAKWAAEAPRKGWSPVALERGANAFEDFIASAIAGARDTSATKLRNYARTMGVGNATVIGSDRKSPPQIAALVNGTIGHTAEMDDNFFPGLGHCCTVVFPPLMALGEELGSNLADLVDAFIVGSEVMARVARVVTGVHTDRGWHGTSTLGAVAAAAGCARLLRLDAEGMNHAIGLSVSMAAGPKAQFGYEAKPLHAGLASQAGLLAARLAEQGLTSNPEIIEAKSGFAELYGIGTQGLQEPAEGAVLALERWGLALKLYPSCGSTHRALDALITLREEHRFQSDQVQKVLTEVEFVNALNLRYPSPVSPKQAQFSMPYCIAVALRRGRVVLADFTQAAVDDPETRKLMPLVEMRTMSTESSIDPDLRPAHRVTVTLKDGREFQAEVRLAKGTAHNPFNLGDRDAKFADCCAGMLDAEAQRGLLKVLRSGLDKVQVGDIMRMLQFSSEPASAEAARG